MKAKVSAAPPIPFIADQDLATEYEVDSDGVSDDSSLLDSSAESDNDQEALDKWDIGYRYESLFSLHYSYST